MMNVPWRIEMFGGLRAYPEGRPDAAITRFATAKIASLLAYLAYHPRRVHPREELADRFWPEVSPEAGRGSLRSALTSLRRQLEPPGTPTGAVLAADRATVRLEPRAYTTDIADFEAAVKRGDRETALCLYRGELLPGFYDEWVLDERERLAALFETACDEMAPATADAPPRGAAPPPAILPRLPLLFTPLFGREEEIAHLCRLVAPDAAPRRRLVTLTGPGGTGKTRLAVEVARAAAPAFGGAVFFVTLADVTDAAAAVDRIAGAVSEDTAVDRPPLERASRALAAHPAALLVLDNLEHLQEHGRAGAAVLGFVLALLERTPGLTILAASRRRLSTAGEREWPVAPLAVPDQVSEGAGAADIQKIASCPSVQLFVDRAQAVRPDFQVTPRNAAAVAALCARLDGLPLALELAAARAHSLTPTQMLDGLQQRWDLLATSRRDKAERHRSLHAAISWSVDLLPPSLTSYWARLSVFRGGCTPMAAAAITGEADALESLTRLRERSLLVAEEAAGTMRFRLLASLREFASTLVTSGEAALSARHAAFFLDLAESTLPHLQRREASRHLDALDAERDNLNAALGWCRSETAAGDAAAARMGLRFGGALWRFWELRGHLYEGRAWLDAVLSDGAGDGTPERARALNGAGMLAARQGDYAAARRWHEESLALNRRLGDRQGIATALGNLGLVAAEQGRHQDARALYEESLALRREVDDQYGIGLMLNNLGTLTYELGDYEQARAYLEEALEARRAFGDRGGVAATLGNLGNVVFLLGDYSTARSLHEEGLAVLRELGDKRGTAYALLNLGEMAATQGESSAALSCHAECLPLLLELGDRWALGYALDSVAGLAAASRRWEIAARLRGAAAGLREATGSAVPPNQQNEHARAIASIREVLGAAAFAAAFEAGRHTPPEEAIAVACRVVLPLHPAPS